MTPYHVAKASLSLSTRVLQLIHEARWLKRLSIQIPESAESVLQQESRFKNYKNHLELVLSEYKALCESVPISLQSLFDPHVQAVAQNFQPGLTTLAWNSMNIGKCCVLSQSTRLSVSLCPSPYSLSLTPTSRPWLRTSSLD